jgi:hypothetical protein
VERRREPLALPLVDAPQPEEPLDPRRELERPVLRVARLQHLQHLERRVLVADRGVLDGLEEVVRHQVGLVGLFGLAGLARPQLGGRLLRVDVRERRDRVEPGEPVGFHPAQPRSQVWLVDPAERREATRGIAIHRRVTDRGLRAVRGREQHRTAQVREHPDRGRTHGAGCSAADVVGRPRRLTPIAVERCDAPCTACRRRSWNSEPSPERPARPRRA